MSTSTWQPDQPHATPVSAADLEQFAHHANSADTLIKQAPYDSMGHIMRQSFSYWEPLLSQQDDATLWQLMQFFTTAEAADSAWSALEQSPAIYCNKVLKQRGIRLDKTQLQWLREHGNNRFIPNGAIAL